MAQRRTAKNPPKQLVKAYFPPPQLIRLKKAAKREGLSVSSFVVKTVNQQLETDAAK